MNSLQADLRKQKLALARTIGLPLDRDFAWRSRSLDIVAIPEPAGPFNWHSRRDAICKPPKHKFGRPNMR